VRAALLVLLLVPTPALAETNPLAWKGHATLAARISDAAVWAQIGGETVASLRAERRGRALGCQALRTGLVVGVSELTKAVVHRTRPDGSDRKSFYSEHTALAFVNTGWRYQVSVPIALGVGYLRPAANKHYVTDVLVGAGVGALAERICR
jgi:membrane-associated phospholipid phosphatase